MEQIDSLSEAAQSSNVSGALQQLMLSRGQNPDPRQQMQQTLAQRVSTPQQAQQIDQQRQSSLQAYQQSLMQPPMGNFTPTEQGLYSWLDNIGKTRSPFEATARGIAAGGEALRQREAAKAQGQMLASKVGYEDAKDQDNQGLRELNALRMGLGAGARNQGKFIQFKDDKGNLYIMNNATGERQVIQASQSPLWSKAYQLGFNKAVENRSEDPEGFATEFANRAIQNSPAASTAFSTIQEPQVPVPSSSEPSPASGDVPTLNFTPDIPQAQIKAMIDRIQDPIQKAEAQVAYDRKYGQRAVLPPKDLRAMGQQEELGKKEGAGLWQEGKDMEMLMGANTKLVSQLNMLENLYKAPNIPEGELAPQIQGLRSGLKSVGIDVAENVGLTDMVTAISTGLALSMKNADGRNLLPGAMSNYEDQLLQKMAPTLSLTQNGRLGMIAFMKEVAGSNMRLAQEATEMAKANRKAPNSLPTDWSARKERIMLEEMAKLKDRSRQIVQQYGAR